MINASKNVIVKVALELQSLCVFEKHGNLGRSKTEFALSHEELAPPGGGGYCHIWAI